VRLISDRTSIISGKHNALGTLFAAVDPSARYVQPKVAELRFAALLTPFNTVAEAEAALSEAGASVSGGAK
jgi:hypothetical protein